MFGLEAIDDGELLEGLKTLAGRDRETQALLVAHLAEIAARRAFVERGFPSLWAYVTDELRFSEGMAQKRIAAAKVAARFPEAVAMIEDGRISLCAVAALEKALPEMKDATLLYWAVGRTKKDVEDKVRGPDGKPPERNEIRKVWEDDDGTAVHEVRATADDELVANLRRLCDLLGTHRLNDVMVRATNRLLDQVDPERRHARRVVAAAKSEAKLAPELEPKPQPTGRPPNNPGIVAGKLPAAAGKLPEPITRYLPRWFHDLVLSLDGHQCVFVGPGGKRCPARRYLQIDHVHPFAVGGGRSLDPNDFRTYCACHNLHQARKTFGVLVPAREETSNREPPRKELV